MEYSMEQRIKIIKTYWENKGAMESTIQKLEEIFGAEGIAVPKSDDIRSLEAQFLETGSLRDEENQSSEEDYDEEEEVEEEEEEEDEDQVKVQVNDIFKEFYDDYISESEDADR